MNVQMIRTIEMTRRIREQHYEQLSGKSQKERISFYQEKANRMEAMVPFLLQDLTAISTALEKVINQEND